MVEELKAAIASVRDAYAKTDSREISEAYDLAYSRAFDLIRDHGQALFEAVERGDRYRDALVNIRDSTFRSAVTLRGYADDRLSAIDLARTKASAGETE